MSLQVYGIRHHGPGCARSLLAALGEFKPDVVVLEGPADGEEALPLVPHIDLTPPVAMLLYPPEEPKRAVYYPLAEFSPEWQALRWAFANGVAVRLMDLPQTIQLAMAKEAEEKAAKKMPGEPSAGPADSSDPNSPNEADEPPTWRADPIAVLAEAAGYNDHELWWENQIERRLNALDLFAAIREAMASVRGEFPEQRPRDLLREAHMRRTLRDVLKAGHVRIAVICGAWHSPVLDEEAVRNKRPGCTAKEDEAVLKGLPKLKTTATWIPWTYSRLTYFSGYGAGIHSPGWYGHLWNSREQAPLRWITTAARLLRDKDLDASSASVIEAIRLADTLAALRELHAPGLQELNEAILSVLCGGDQAPLRLIRRQLEIGDRLGEVPAETPAVPLAQDLARQQKSLRLKPSAESKLLDLDLRNETDRQRSHLLHQLLLLGVAWGQVQRSGSKTSTFHEIWKVEWRPDFAVAVIEASVWGTTLPAAGAAKAISQANNGQDLAQISALLNTVILAGLDEAIDPLLSRIQSQAAVAADVRHLMDALPPLATVARYGDVRGTSATHVEPILVGMFERAMVGLAVACAGLDDEAAARMLASVGHVQRALDLLGRDELKQEWQEKLQLLAGGTVHPLLRGACCRSLLEQGRYLEEDLYRRARLELAVANPPGECAAWATGLLKGSGLVLLHQEGIWQVFDRWLCELNAETFTEMLALLRRAFSDFSTAERRQMGEKVKHLGNAKTPSRSISMVEPANLDIDRARRPLPILAQILGVTYLAKAKVPSDDAV